MRRKRTTIFLSDLDLSDIAPKQDQASKPFNPDEIDFPIKRKSRGFMFIAPRRTNSDDKISGTTRETFKWPSTEAPASKNTLSNEFTPKGLLGACGYNTGKNGLVKRQRQRLLRRIYKCELPAKSDTLPKKYLDEWGAPQTAKRLSKLANTLATLTRNEKRKKRGDFAKSIADKENDLSYLKSNFYDGKYDFKWPSTTTNKRSTN